MRLVHTPCKGVWDSIFGFSSIMSFILWLSGLCYYKGCLGVWFVEIVSCFASLTISLLLLFLMIWKKSVCFPHLLCHCFKGHLRKGALRLSFVVFDSHLHAERLALLVYSSNHPLLLCHFQPDMFLRAKEKATSSKVYTPRFSVCIAPLAVCDF